MEWIEYFKIAVTVGGILMGYHKFNGKTMHDMQFKFLEQ